MTPEDAMNTEKRRPSVLFVDDEPELLRMIRVALEDKYEVETAASAEEADLLMASGSYDVLVCDHMLPGESGLDFLIRMRRRHPAVRRFLVTGYINPEFLSRSTTLAELSGCILKPSITSDLANAIARSLEDKLP